ncbi:MAG: hypothetical protein JSW28_06425 [Thermoplasmata archaeon]|nr:MAG: hypothetical protein JSW28_06425 [Thermoplasmata archaeon]
MKKAKYVALLAVAVLFVAAMSALSDKPPDMDPPDGNKHPVYQTDYPPVIDGVVQVGITWPAEAWIGHTYIAGGNQVGDIPTTDVYILFDTLDGYTQVDNPPEGYGSEDEVTNPNTGLPYYLYIGVKAIGDYKIHYDGSWIRIDWDQDGYIDFKDNNGNSAGPPRLYSTQFAVTPDGAEWAIPYLDEYNGPCQSELDIIVHIEIELPGGGTETTTFPGRGGSGPFLSTTICPWEEIEPEPPEPGDWGIRTIGFWKHQLRCALGICNGHQHVPTENLIAYLAYISASSQIPELIDMDTDMYAALALLELRGQHPMYDRAVQQLLATWLNYVSGNEMWDSDGDGVPDTYIIDTILWAEAGLLDGDPTNDEDIKDTLDALNNSGDE